MAAEAVVALLLDRAVLEVLGNDAPLVQEGALRLPEADPVLFLVETVLARVSLKGKRQHIVLLAQVWLQSHTHVGRGIATNSAA